MSVRQEVRGHALWLTIDREERRNALGPEVIDGLIDGLARAAEEPETRVVVITGAGDRAFSAGGDIGGFAAAAGGRSPAEQIADLLRALRDHPEPVIARVNGRALGGGLGLLLACDLAVAAEDVEFGTPEVNIGLWPHVITAVIRERIPRAVALEMMLTGRRLTAEEAARTGIVNRMVPRADLDAAVVELVEELAAKSPAVLRLGKRSFNGATDRVTFEDALAFLAERLEENLSLDDLAEGVAAFLEKREPRWKGR